MNKNYRHTNANCGGSRRFPQNAKSPLGCEAPAAIYYPARPRITAAGEVTARNALLSALQQGDRRSHAAGAHGFPSGSCSGSCPPRPAPSSPAQPNPAQPSPRGARTYRQQRAQHHRPAGARGRDLRAPLSAAAPLRRRAATAAAWENGYFMNGRAARPSAHARPRGSMNGWAPGRQCACSPPFYEWGRRGARGGRARPWPRCGLLL